MSKHKSQSPKHAVVLHPGKDKPIKHYHHWIFSGAVASAPRFEPGDILPVVDHTGLLIGHGYFNAQADIFGRMLSFGDADPLRQIAENLRIAALMRRTWFDESQTNAYRLVNGEADRIPGLVVDKYADVLVTQFSTAGMEKLRPQILDMLIEQFNPRFIYDKSDLPSRRKEGLQPTEGLAFGEQPTPVTILENGAKFLVDIPAGHKTGFYLDQREMRGLIGELSKGKRVLNCFAYTGGFSVFAALNGAKQVTSVDISDEAIKMAETNFELNGIQSKDHSFVAADVFKFLRADELDYDIVILDPPAFAKKRADLDAAVRGYRDINRQALQKMPAGSLLLTCSCSYHMDDELFQKVIFQAAADTGRTIKIIHKHRLAPDHGLNIYQPEADYLKSLLLWVY